MLATLEQAQSDFGEHAADFASCVREALKLFLTNHVALRHAYSKRTEASIIHDYMALAFRERFSSDGPVSVHAMRNTTVISVLGGKYQAKLKKLNERLHTRNIPTQAALNFVHQEHQLWLEIVPAPTNLHIGYQPGDDAALTESRMWITCPTGTKKTAWAWEISHGEAASSGADVLPLHPSDLDGAKKRAKLKKPEQEEASGEGAEDDAADKE